MDSQRVQQWKDDIYMGKFRDVGRDIRSTLDSLGPDLHFMVRHWLTEASWALDQRRVDSGRVQLCLDEALCILCPNLNWADSE